MDGTPIAGFSPDTTAYRVVAGRPDRATVEVTPRDPYAAVSIRRAGRVVTATVTSEDGSRQRDYRVELTRH